MKSIKLYLCALLIGMFSISCSDDDENKGSNNIVPQEAIVGMWSLRDRMPHGIEVCELQTTFQFAEENIFEAEIYEGDEPGNCVSVSISGEYYFQEKYLAWNIDGYDTLFLEISFQDGGNRMELSSEDVTEIYIKQ